MSDDARATKIHELTQSLTAVNHHLSCIDTILEEPTLRALEAIAIAVHRTGALVIEIAQERHDCIVCPYIYEAPPQPGDGVPAPTGSEDTTPRHKHPSNTGLPRPGDAPRVRPAKRRK